MTLFKGLYQEFGRCKVEGQILKKEAELAKEQLRTKVYQLLQLEKFLEKPESKLESNPGKSFSEALILASTKSQYD